MSVSQETMPTPVRARKRRRVFLWFFLVVQALFLAWLISGLATGTGPSAAQVAQLCGHHNWYPVFTSLHDCTVHGANGLTAAGDIGKSIAVGLIVLVWVVVDFLLSVTYGIYRLARRPRATVAN